MFKPLTDVLFMLAEYYEDVEIRDRAHFYYQLLTHVSSEKISIILSEPKSADEEEAVAIVSAPAPAANTADDENLVTKYPHSFLMLQPVTTGTPVTHVILQLTAPRQSVPSSC
jgi:hypothetical protein